jgi:hypothetical protein
LRLVVGEHKFLGVWSFSVRNLNQLMGLVFAFPPSVGDSLMHHVLEGKSRWHNSQREPKNISAPAVGLSLNGAK